jgi:hypothetical protein
VTLRRLASAATTIVVAIVVALAVPVSQLRTVTIVKACCCPDPSTCHCPDHKAEKGTQPSMRACHNTQNVIVAPEMPSFTEPVIAIVSAPERIAVAPASPLRSPHASPPPAEPDGPS